MSIFVINSDDFKKFEKANRITADTLSLVAKYVKPGVSTLELDKIAEDYILSQNAKPAFKGFQDGNETPFPNTICASVDEVVVHGIPNRRNLKEGEIISIDMGVEYEGFFGDSAITCPVGVVSEEKAKLIKVTQESLEKGIENAIEGRKVYDISKVIQAYCEGFGYNVVRELIGHGIGDKLHDDPPVPNYVPLLLHRANLPNWKLIKGLAIAIEPMVMIGDKAIETLDDGWGVRTKDKSATAHWEHTIVIENGKPIIMTLRN
jgi:methionyl aminopeptidase